jgi:hypothetical protein
VFETGLDHHYRMMFRDVLIKVLGDATSVRDQRRDTVQTPDGPEPGWVVYEREQMLTAVNRERASRGLPPASMDAIARVDTQSAGHVDWLEKFALRCSELAFGLRET